CLQGGECVEPGASYLAFQHANSTASTLDGHGPPVLLLQGLKDTTVPPGLAACAVRSLQAAGVKTQVCTDATADHAAIVSDQAGFALGWTGALLGGTTLPACDGSGLPTCMQ